MTIGGSPHPFVHGVESQHIRKVLWADADALQEPAFEMTAGAAEGARQRFNSDPALVLLQTANGMLESQISPFVSSQPLAERSLETRDAIFLAVQVHESVLEPARPGVEDLFAVERAVDNAAVRLANQSVGGFRPYDDPNRGDAVGER